MTSRRATPEELVQHFTRDIRNGRRVMFRHFIREIYAPNTRNGVRHQQYGRARVFLDDAGLPCVRHHGKAERLTATWQDTDWSGAPYSCGPIICDVRLHNLPA